MQARHNPRLIADLRRAGVVPVLTIDDPATGVALGQALVAGGLTMLEVTLRTPASLEALKRMAKEIAGATVGAGTVLNEEQGRQAVAAGARFLVAPGATTRLLDAAEKWPVPLLPGIATASEAMSILERGYTVAKFFPAEQAGGAAVLKAFAAPLRSLVFCPTGGITAENAPTYLALDNVAAVGGSWVAPAAAIAARNWAHVTALSTQAARFARAKG
jgi:2-dehydro-3-deoxyphosphogluconate aldolase/(4S)-4-hydroxy-2-oxoglutarate aldolase